MINEIQKNADRFTGFADTYESARPVMPVYPVKIIIRYLEKQPDTVTDLGCGTGLSTVVWKDFCKHVIGIEPSLDMLAVAQKKQSGNISFINGYSHDTGLEDNCTDVVICSQSFHWMEPVTTLKEVNRILKTGGVFATVDCDWPPIAKWQAEQAYNNLYEKVKKMEIELPDIKDTFTRYEKDKHLSNIRESGYFRYSREVVFSNTEKCTAERFINIILSQGSLQTLLKKHPELIQDDIERFSKAIKDIFKQESFEIDFSYRMRIAVK